MSRRDEGRRLDAANEVATENAIQRDGREFAGCGLGLRSSFGVERHAVGTQRTAVPVEVTDVAVAQQIDPPPFGDRPFFC